MEYKFKTKWNESTDINWWKSSRIELNRIIDAYNYWQINGFDTDEGKTVLSQIEYGKQTIGALDGGSAYFDELDDMEQYIKNRTHN